MNTPSLWISTCLFACLVSACGPTREAAEAKPATAPSSVSEAEQSAQAPAAEPAAPNDATGALAPGDAAPMTDRPMKNVDETDVTIASIAGDKGTLVVFTCNHCPFAQGWEGRITALGNSFREQGVGVIAINANDTERYPGDAFEPMQERAKAAGMAFPYVMDATSEVARAFGATKTPEAFLFDAEHKLVYRGAIDDNANEPANVQEHYLKDALNALVQGEAISPAIRPAIGCSIKLRPVA